MKINISDLQAENIEYIIFDFGGVIMDIDIQKTITGFAKLQIAGLSEEDVIADNESFFLDLELGNITPAQFIDTLHRNYPASSDIPEADVWAAWNALLQPYEKKRIDLLEKISESYKIYLLSNTNYPHREKFRDMYKKQFGGNFDNLFTECFYSDEMHLRKPDIQIYQEVTNALGIQPEKILFIDDKKVNIEAARDCGWHAYQLTNGEQITDIFIP